MRPVRISFGCFGAFPGEESVNLNDVGRDGLFLICGDTGAGKTTLLDAICYALYYVSSSGSRNDPGKGSFEKMRSRFVDESDKRPTYVELELEKNGETYIFRRELKPKKRVSGFDEVHGAFKLVGGERVPAVDNPTETNVNNFALKLTGLTADQFRQIIILPQGRFEQLLTSDSASKEVILSTLFGLETWEKAVERFKEKVKAERDDVNGREIAIKSKLATQQCASVSELETRAAEKQASIPALETVRTEKNAAFSRISTEVGQANAVEEKFVELEKRRKTLSGFEILSAGIELERARLKTAETAEKLRPALDTVRRLREEESRAAANARDKQQASACAKDDSEKADKAWREHDDKRQIYEESGATIVRFESARPDYKAFADLKAKAADLETELRAAFNNLKDAQKAAKDADNAFIAAEKAYQESRAEHDRVRRLYILSYAGRLAEGLTEGEACPVCGSVHHPAPAAKSAEHVTDADLNRAEQAEKRAEERYKAADKAAKERKDEATKAEMALKDVQGRNLANQQGYEAAKAKLIPGIETAEQLEIQIARYKKAREKYEDDDKQLKTAREDAEKRLNTANGQFTEAESTLTRKTAERKEAELTFAQQLVSEGFADEAALASALIAPSAIDALRKKISDFDNGLAHAKQELDNQLKAVEGLTRPDMIALKASLEQAKQDAESSANAVTTAKTELNTMTALKQELEGMEKELELRRAAFDRHAGFAGMLDSKGMNLHRYVLASMLGSVIEQANKLLLNVHGGRYELRRSADPTGGKQKAGLELNVFDHGNNYERSVKSLSGGEKFLVSLALAIGLNTVMQSQCSGVRVEAIFVDEGFGTLDNDSVADAMQMLNRVRLSRGMVGIISHVDLLRSEIPSHIEIHKDASHGSKIVGC